jgi:hypothetical protein
MIGLHGPESVRAAGAVPALAAAVVWLGKCVGGALCLALV